MTLGKKGGGNGDGFIGYDLPIFGERPEALADSALKGGGQQRVGSPQHSRKGVLE